MFSEAILRVPWTCTMGQVVLRIHRRALWEAGSFPWAPVLAVEWLGVEGGDAGRRRPPAGGRTARARWAAARWEGQVWSRPSPSTVLRLAGTLCRARVAGLFGGLQARTSPSMLRALPFRARPLPTAPKEGALRAGQSFTEYRGPVKPAASDLGVFDSWEKDGTRDVSGVSGRHGGGTGRRAAPCGRSRRGVLGTWCRTELGTAQAVGGVTSSGRQQGAGVPGSRGMVTRDVAFGL